jgi:hypothetical protein
MLGIAVGESVAAVEGDSVGDEVLGAVEGVPDVRSVEGTVGESVCEDSRDVVVVAVCGSNVVVAAVMVDVVCGVSVVGEKVGFTGELVGSSAISILGADVASRLSA